MNAMEILVIILSVFLAIFLLVGIVLAILLVKVTLQIRRVTTKAEKAADSMESLAKNVSGFASKALISQFVMKGIKTVRKRRGGQK